MPAPRRRPFLVAVLTGAATAILLVAWWAVTDRAACQAGNDADPCGGAALLVALVGVPAYLLALWGALGAGRATRRVLGVAVVLGVTYALVLLSEGVDPVPAVWPFAVAALTGAYVGLEPRLLREPGRS